MIISFFILNVIIFLWVSLTTCMFSNQLKQISRSIDIYLDPKAYKPKSQISFIDSLVDKYKGYEDEVSMERGIDALMNDCFYKQKIGVFNVSTIDSIAHKGKQLLWVSMLLMVSVEGLTTGLGQSVLHSWLMIGSGGLGLVLIFFQLYKHIDLEKEKLFAKTKNYLHHTYPNLKQEQNKQKEVSLLVSKISVLEGEVERLEQISQQSLKETESQQLVDVKEIEKESEKETELAEEDIIHLIEYFV